MSAPSSPELQLDTQNVPYLAYIRGKLELLFQKKRPQWCQTP